MSRRLLPVLLLMLVPFTGPPSVPAEALQRGFAMEPAAGSSSQRVVLHGVDIDPNTGNILPAALPVLDAAVEILSKSGGVIEIVAQRYEAGGEPFDPALEQHRAAVVQQYLVQHGVAADRILVRGSGISSVLSRHAMASDTVEALRVELHGD